MPEGIDELDPPPPLGEGMLGMPERPPPPELPELPELPPPEEPPDEPPEEGEDGEGIEEEDWLAQPPISSAEIALTVVK